MPVPTSHADAEACAGTDGTDVRAIPFTKGHGTENDFVLIEDAGDSYDLSPAQVARICDRRAGIGADGLLRVVRGGLIPGWAGDPDIWFMDYRNADGSIAEMCGNGVRVFVRYLLARGLVDGPKVDVGTRDGVKPATVLPDGRIRVAMGPSRVLGHDVEVRPWGHRRTDRSWTAYRVDVGNPHAVSLLGPSDDGMLADLDLTRTPSWQPPDRFPDGVNLEFVRTLGPSHLQLRVFERGSGETRSCGTGTCAAAAAAAAADGVDPAGARGPVTYRVDVPGGTVEVELAVGQTYLTGPAVLVARGELTLPTDV